MIRIFNKSVFSVNNDVIKITIDSLTPKPAGKIETIIEMAEENKYTEEYNIKSLMLKLKKNKFNAANCDKIVRR